jgi:hypothetical protein
VRLSQLSALVLAAASLTACGERPNDDGADASQLDWVQSRTGSTRYAYLEARDTTDTWIFGASVIKVQDFLSSSLDMVVRPMNVKLKLRTAAGARKLDVVTVGDKPETLLTFNAAVSGGKTEVDFQSAGNDVTLRSFISQVGGMLTAHDENGYWVSTGAPTVQQIQQDKDTLVVDLGHTIRQAITKTDASGRLVLDHYVSDHAGKVTVRIFLKRKAALPQIGVTRTVAGAKAQNIGFFGTSLDETAPTSQIQRLALGDARGALATQTFYLKDVPAAYQALAKTAILSWNTAFDSPTDNTGKIRVAIAPAALDVGDPRYNVVKWFDGLDADVSWAGVAKMIVEPDTGLVMGGDLYLNGGTVLEMYKGITAFSQAAKAGGIHKVSGSIGGVNFSRDEGETPVIPYLTDTTKSYDQYMRDYYVETIAHEMGHVLGLRHNFRGTTQLEDDETASVMDYAPRSDRDHYPGPGSYDIAAIRYGYFGELPRRTLPFCTDEDIWTFYDCSQGDWGDTVKYSVNGLLDGTELLAEQPLSITDDVFISSITGALENALKIKKLQAQLPASTRAATVAKIDAARTFLYTAAPAANLSGSALTTVKANLAKMRELAKKHEDELKADGHL